jgi:hypothetical protein
MYQVTKAQSRDAIEDALVASGALTDELTSVGLGTGPSSIGAVGDPVDERVVPETQNTADESDLAKNLYGGLQALRADAGEARGLLQNYALGTSPALRGEMYALEGYADLILAELYCSGVPLSTLDYGYDFTYHPGESTQDVTRQAVVLFDSALAISSDSASIMALASVGKGRALLDLGEYTEAAQAAHAVPSGFQYALPLQVFRGDSIFTVADREGRNGLPFVTAQDPRVIVSAAGTNPFGLSLYTPAKYDVQNGTPSVILASSVEAQLIEAEVALHNGDASWLTILNTLRTTCTDAATCPTPAPAGTGGIAGLPPLSDPAASASGQAAIDARVNLLFSERAYWLFLTTTRQADLRRLVRNYGRRQDAVYPTGPYYGGRGIYGSDVNLPIPPEERANPLFQGCIDRQA